MNPVYHIALTAAVKAGKVIMDIYKEEDLQVEMKEDQSPVTKADKAAHKIIEQLLCTTEIPVFSEEGEQYFYAERKTWDLYWLIDPLDGTKEFIKRNGEFTVNIALIQKGEPLFGVVYAPALHNLYWGVKGEGAYKWELIKEGEITVQQVESAQKLFPGSLPKVFTLVGSRSHLTKETRLFYDKIKETAPNLEIISIGSSLKFCLMAEGKAHFYPRMGPTMEWDTAAGHAIAEAAGCIVTDWGGNTMKYNKKNLENPWFKVCHPSVEVPIK